MKKTMNLREFKKLEVGDYFYPNTLTDYNVSKFKIVDIYEHSVGYKEIRNKKAVYHGSWSMNCNDSFKSPIDVFICAIKRGDYD
jgi:hypothetical protein